LETQATLKRTQVLAFFRELKEQRARGKKEFTPIIVVFDDNDLLLEGLISNKVTKLNKCIHARLGIVNSADRIYDILLNQIPGGGDCKGSRNKTTIIDILVSKIKEDKTKRLIVVEKCQYLKRSDLFTLMGLMLELVGLIQFVFIFPKSYWTTFGSSVKAAERDQVGVFLSFAKDQFELFR
jgi:hypothetical protein